MPLLYFISEGRDHTSHGALVQIKGAGYLAFTSSELGEAFLAFTGLSADNHLAPADSLPLAALPTIVRATVFATPHQLDAMLADRQGYPYATRTIEYRRPLPSSADASA